MSDRKDFQCLVCETSGVELSVSVKGNAMMFDEIVLHDKNTGDFKRFRIVETPVERTPLGWIIRDMEKPPITDEEREANTDMLIAQWGAMEKGGTLHDAWEGAINMATRGMNREQRRVYRAKNPNPYKKGNRLS